jgi:aspartate aminotransferase
LAYVLKLEDLKNAMECLAEAIKVYPGRTNWKIFNFFIR